MHEKLYINYFYTRREIIDCTKEKQILCKIDQKGVEITDEL